MTVLRGLQRAQLWNTSGYVCHSCRYKLQLSRRQLTRSQTNLSTTEGSVDDWLSNFNDLSELHTTRDEGASEDAFKRISTRPGKNSNGDGLEHGGAEDVEKRQSSRAAGSPSFSRMRPQLPSRKIQRRQHGDIEAKAREVQIRLEAANTSQNTAVGSSSPTISLNKQHSPRPWTAPPWYGSLHELASRVGQNGFQAEALRLAKLQSQAANSDPAWRHMSKNLSTTLLTVEWSIATIILKAFNGEITALVEDQIGGPAREFGQQHLTGDTAGKRGGEYDAAKHSTASDDIAAQIHDSFEASSRHSIQRSTIAQRAAVMAERKLYKEKFFGRGSRHRSLAGWQHFYEKSLTNQKSRQHAKAAATMRSVAETTPSHQTGEPPLEDAVSEDSMLTNAGSAEADHGDATTYSPMDEDGVSDFVRNADATKASEALTATDSDRSTSQFEATLQQLVPAVNEILSKARNAYERDVKAPADSYEATSNLVGAIKLDQESPSAKSQVEHSTDKEDGFSEPPTGDAQQYDALTSPRMPTSAPMGASRRSEAPVFPNTNAGFTLRTAAQPDTAISPLRGPKPIPEKPSFEGSANPFASSRTSSHLGSDKPLSLAQQVDEANGRPKWGGIVTTSAIQPLSSAAPESASEKKAEAISSNAAFRPFGLDVPKTSEAERGNSSFLDSLQKPTRFDSAVAASTSPDNEETKDTEPSISRPTSWLWNKLFSSSKKSKETAVNQSPGVDDARALKSKDSAVQDLHQLQQRLSQEMLAEAKPDAPVEVVDESASALNARSDSVATVLKSGEDSEGHDAKMLVSSESELPNDQHETQATDSEASAESLTDSVPSALSFRRIDATWTPRPVMSSPGSDQKRQGGTRSPLIRKLVGPPADSSNQPLDEATSPTVDDSSDRLEHASVARQKHDADPAAAGIAGAEAHNHQSSVLDAVDDTASQRLASLHSRSSLSGDGAPPAEVQARSILDTPSSTFLGPDNVSLGTLENRESAEAQQNAATNAEPPTMIDESDSTTFLTVSKYTAREASGIRRVSAPGKLSQGQRVRLRRVMTKHAQAVARGDQIAGEKYLAFRARLMQQWSQDRGKLELAPDSSHAQAAATSPALNDSANGTESAATGGNGNDDNDDGDDKPLWEVMSKAEALSNPDAIVEADSETTGNGETSEVEEAPLDLSTRAPTDVSIIKPAELEVKPLGIPQPSVPGLEYGLDRVLFNPGVYQLQDPLSRVYNFDPYLQKIMPVVEFDFNALKEYKTSSQDTMLSALAKEHEKRYIGSTSSMTGMLGHFHYLLSNWRALNLNMLSRGFTDKLDTFTLLNRAPNAIFLRWKNGTYAIDADKQYDSGNVLMLLGKSMEKLLTRSTSEYERYRKSDPRTVSEEERTAPEAFEYTTMGDFLMRSQLDAHDPRLPGTGMFDLKTRAVLTVRMDSEDFQPMTGYEIHSLQGRFGSYEREFYDMMRSTMLKYMLQARMGRMDGIFIAYHNVERIFGFQYLPIQEMDRAIHGQVDRCLGDQEFKTSLELVNKAFDKATAKFPEQSLRFHFEAATESLGGSPTAVMWIFAEPMTDQEIDRIQSSSKEKIAEFERTMMGVEQSNDSALVDESARTVSSDNDSATAPRAATQQTSEMSSTYLSASSEVTTSNAEADSGFLNAMTASSTMERKPFFAASLICKSRVNGISVERPEGLKSTDVWEVEYLLREWDAPDSMWARYEQMKARRQEMFERLKSEEEDSDGNGELTSKQKREKAFTEFLRSMSQSGREFRNKIDKLEAGKEPVIVGQPLQASSKIVDEGIGTVDQYTAWLYGKDRS